MSPEAPYFLVDKRDCLHQASRKMGAKPRNPPFCCLLETESARLLPFLPVDFGMLGFTFPFVLACRSLIPVGAGFGAKREIHSGEGRR